MLPKIVIWVEAYWEKRTNTAKEIEGWGWTPVTEYGGGYHIIKCPGFPEINGGYCTPDFNYTVETLRQKFVKQYTEWANNTHEVIVHIKVTKDERVTIPNSLDAFF